MSHDVHHWNFRILFCTYLTTEKSGLPALCTSVNNLMSYCTDAQQVWLSKEVSHPLEVIRERLLRFDSRSMNDHELHTTCLHCR